MIGIDPGRKGALAFLLRGDRFFRSMKDMPLAADGSICIRTVTEWLLEWYAQGTLVMVESGLTMPGRNSHGGTYLREQGQIVGAAVAAAYTARIAVTVAEVPPQTWKSFFGLCGQGKQGSVQYLLDKRRVTVADLTPARARKPSDGRSDALMIAMYGAMTEGWNAIL